MFPFANFSFQTYQSILKNQNKKLKHNTYILHILISLVKTVNFHKFYLSSNKNKDKHKLKNNGYKTDFIR